MAELGLDFYDFWRQLNCSSGVQNQLIKLWHETPESNWSSIDMNRFSAANFRPAMLCSHSSGGELIVSIMDHGRFVLRSELERGNSGLINI